MDILYKQACRLNVACCVVAAFIQAEEQQHQQQGDNEVAYLAWSHIQTCP